MLLVEPAVVRPSHSRVLSCAPNAMSGDCCTLWLSSEWWQLAHEYIGRGTSSQRYAAIDKGRSASVRAALNSRALRAGAPTHISTAVKESATRESVHVLRLQLACAAHRDSQPGSSPHAPKLWARLSLHEASYAQPSSCCSRALRAVAPTHISTAVRECYRDRPTRCLVTAARSGLAPGGGSSPMASRAALCRVSTRWLS